MLLALVLLKTAGFLGACVPHTYRAPSEAESEVPRLWRGRRSRRDPGYIGWFIDLDPCVKRRCGTRLALRSSEGGICNDGVGTVGSPSVGVLVDLPGRRAAICLMFFVLIVRAVSGGGGFMCMGGHDHGADETRELRREVRELREELNRLRSAR